MKAIKKPVEVDYFVYKQSEDFHTGIRDLKVWVESLGDEFFSNFSKDVFTKKLELESLVDGIVLIKDRDVIVKEGNNYLAYQHDIFYQTHNIQ